MRRRSKHNRPEPPEIGDRVRIGCERLEIDLEGQVESVFPGTDRFPVTVVIAGRKEWHHIPLWADVQVEITQRRSDFDAVCNR